MITNGTDRELLSERHFRVGYILRKEKVSLGASDEAPITMISAFTLDGHYIGNSKFAHRLVVKRGIAPELADSSHNVCSIGFCAKEQRWYGWSHRAIYGFGIGAKVKEGDCAASSGWTDDYLAEHPEENTALPVGFTAHTLEDAKRMAVAFASSVG